MHRRWARPTPATDGQNLCHGDTVASTGQGHRMLVSLLPLVLLAALAAGCGEAGEMPSKQVSTTTEDLIATASGLSRLIGPSSLCGDGAPPDVVLACGIRAAHPRHKALPTRPSGTINLRFKAKVGRLLVEEKRADRAGPIEEVAQLKPVSTSSDGRRWTIRAPAHLTRNTVLGLVALYEEAVRIRRLSDGSTVPIENAVIQFQLPLRETAVRGQTEGLG